MKRILASIMLILSMAISGCGLLPGGTSSSVQVSQSWIRAQTSGNNTAAFMLIKNTAAQDDKLIKAESNISMKVVLMDTQMKDMKMAMVNVDSILVPANGQVELKSGSFHVMFMGLNKDLKDGDKIQLTLTFEKSGVLKLDVPVQAPSGTE